MSTTPAGSAKEGLRLTRVLFGAMMLGVTIFAIIIFFLNQTSDAVGINLGIAPDTILLAIGLLAAALFVYARTAYSKKIAAGNFPDISLVSKLNQHRAALIKYLALCEAPALLSVIAFYLTGDYRLLIIVGAMLVAMMLKAPLLKNIIQDLNLDWNEQQELE